MAARRILVIDAHPDPDPARFVHALAKAYEAGAGGHEVRTMTLAKLRFPFLRSTADWTDGKPSPAIAKAQADLAWAQHVVLFYPLWLGDMPAILKAFLEQVLRPGFALAYRDRGFPQKLLKGRTARVVVTMGMPAAIYRVFYRAHSVRSLERNVLAFVGIRPIARTIIGSAGGDAESRRRWLVKMAELGSAGS